MQCWRVPLKQYRRTFRLHTSDCYRRPIEKLAWVTCAERRNDASGLAPRICLFCSRPIGV